MAEIERFETGMILSGNKFRELLTNLGINYHKHNFNLTLRDISNGILNSKDLKPYPYVHKKPCKKEDRMEIEPTIDNIFNGKCIDLLSNNGFTDYTIKVKEKIEGGNVEYIFDTFETFELLSNGEYIRNRMELRKDVIEVYETHGKIETFETFETDDTNDKVKNYVVNNIYRLTAIFNSKNQYISVKDESNERLEKNQYKLILTPWFINDKKEYYLKDEVNDIDNGVDIIENNRLFKAALEVIYPDLYTLYEKKNKQEKQIKL